ncbi:hypothetical protein MSTO_19000 [Mycobacterium stomatepiae]|uniref:Uncharacterized protein n=1 Tax=Mycobacterium stomatepiae TaxID=470076 RepID=A0A7I7Q5R4_9MYCO|nr:hypothetical protein MSTO_19000 [Mycobacterium stomatepiae]
MINADNSTGISSSGVDTGKASTGINNPSVRNPTAKWAIGEILITMGAGVGAAEPEATRASFHPGSRRRFRAASDDHPRGYDWSPPQRI